MQMALNIETFTFNFLYLYLIKMWKKKSEMCSLSHFWKLQPPQKAAAFFPLTNMVNVGSRMK